MREGRERKISEQKLKDDKINYTKQVRKERRGSKEGKK